MTGRKKLCASLIMLAVFVCTTFFAMYASQKQSIEALALNTSFRALGKEEADKISKAASPAYGDAVQALPNEAKKQDYITLIAALDVPTVSDALGEKTVSESIGSAAYNNAAALVRTKQNELLRALKKAGVAYTLENRYNTVLSGVAIRIKTSDFALAEGEITALGGTAVLSETYAVPKTISSSASTYEAAETKDGVTENKVDVQETGIFNSENSPYDGTGTIVAVLDSGFDYTHSVFQKALDDATVAKSLADISSALASTNAVKTTPTLTAGDVYYNNKIPFMYDYADFDADVYPLESEHGTHVAGIIAGDDTQNAVTRDSQGNETQLDYRVRGVAPKAQLALMKVFSDVDAGAKQSHILAAVEDCVNLGVDAINMSLGMSSGFAREVDKEYCNLVYDKVRGEGISLICAASNDYNSTYGSEANGNLPLTSNPDSATVGSPSTYDAALSVASISGVKTPYIEFEGSPIYYIE
ncbi:MAG: S8 family serine peptidase, partial [Clostridiales bacterium]|nr:S8 family serine peptidase [Clostridiales bacterium]